MATITRAFSDQHILGHSFAHVVDGEFSNITYSNSYLSLAPPLHIIEAGFFTNTIEQSIVGHGFSENINTETIVESLFTFQVHNTVFQETTVESEFTYTHSFRADFNNTTLVESDLTYYFESLDFIGTTSPITPSGFNTYITLLCDGAQINIRAPDFGNTDVLSSPRIKRKPRGGFPVLIYGSPRWPIFQELAYEFSYLDPDEATRLIGFLRTSLGKEVTLIDYENITWTGVIITPENEVIEERPRGFSASFNFQGQRVPDSHSSRVTMAVFNERDTT